MLAYFDCFSGISGDMILGALLDLGLSLSELREALSGLLLESYQVETFKDQRGGLGGTRFRVSFQHGEDHHRSFQDIRALIEKGPLVDKVKDQSIRIFRRLAEAEARIHQKPLEKIHFHEVGATDAIIDIVGAVFGLHHLNIDKIICSPLPLGSGLVQCAHGTLPIPAPATLELLRDRPVYGGAIEGELVTPTGAAIISTLADGFGAIPPLRIDKVGYGIGEKDRPEVPNLLRILLGTPEPAFIQETLTVIETNIDNLNPEIYGYLMERLYEQGALDVLFQPVQMKKNRPGILLRVFASTPKKNTLVRTIFEETGTLGIRCHQVERFILQRQAGKVTTPWGEVRTKTVWGADGEKEICPEYEDCRRIAREKNLPLRKIWQQICQFLKS